MYYGGQVSVKEASQDHFDEISVPGNLAMKRQSPAAAAEVFCICRGPDDGSLMIECNYCSEWYNQLFKFKIYSW